MRKRCTLDCEYFTGRKDAHEYISGKLGFPEYYGGNLDALNDCLTDMVPLTITLKNADKAEEGSYAVTLINFFKRLEEKHDDFKLIIK